MAQSPKNNYLYNGKELQDETQWYDYGARMYDPWLGRWNHVDPLAGEYMQYSPYHYVYNNPINYIDPDGRQIDPVKTKDETDENGNRSVEITFNISIKILNNSSTAVNMSAFKKQLRSDLSKAFSGSYEAGNTSYTFETGDIELDNVSSMDQVSDSDHVLTIVDDVTGKTVDKDGNGGEVAGKAEFGMKNLWTEPSSNTSWLSEHSIHELGHSANRQHSWQDGDDGTSNSQNYMSYDRDCPCEFTGRQLIQIYSNRDNLNQGDNYSRATGTEKVTKTTELKPDGNTYKGKKIPRPVGN
jgi:RHS repeat-associated protein